MADQQPSPPSTRSRLRPAVIITVIVVVAAFPAGVWAADAFNDVPDTNTHHNAITAIRDAGVTAGCATGLYCPGDPVRRDQMASFMDRLGALSGQTPVVNAASVEGRTAAQLASRVVSDTFPSAGLTADVTNVGSVDIEAPVAGTLIAQAHSNVVIFGASTVANVAIATSPTALDISVAGVATAGLLDGADTTRRRYPMHPMLVLDVGPGTHTLHLNAQRSPVFGAQTVNLTESVLTVTFVPAG